jgi:hypothetical protein
MRVNIRAATACAMPRRFPHNALEFHFGRSVMPERLHRLRRSRGRAQEIRVRLALRKVLGCRSIYSFDAITACEEVVLG